MPNYDWSKVSRETLERLAQSIHTSHAADVAQDTHLQERLADVRAEGLLPLLRARAEVDAEIVEIVREYIRDVGAEHAFGTMTRDRHRLLRIVAEPLAPDLPPPIDAEFPDPSVPDPCSCEESLELRTRLVQARALLERWEALHDPKAPPFRGISQDTRAWLGR